MCFPLSSDSFIDVDADFHARVPVVVCRDKQSGLLCKVSAGNKNAWLTTKHLTALGKLEPRLVPLVIAFRYWAKLCSIDHPEEGGLPPYVFALMAVFFLQQRKEPLLPVYLGSWIEEFSLNKLGNFSLKDIEKDSVVWEYTDNGTGDTSSAREEAPRETAAKKGQVCAFLSGHTLTFPSGSSCGFYSLVCLPVILFTTLLLTLAWVLETGSHLVSQAEPGAYYVAHSGLELTAVSSSASGSPGIVGMNCHTWLYLNCF